MFYEGQIVKGVVAGHFVIIAMRNIDGEAGAQVKPVNPANLKAGPGEMWLPLDKLRATDAKAQIDQSHSQFANMVKQFRAAADAAQKMAFYEANIEYWKGRKAAQEDMVEAYISVHQLSREIFRRECGL